MILSGGYVEVYWDDKAGKQRYKYRGRFNMGYRNMCQFHRIGRLSKSPTYTLAIVGKRSEHPWGYLVDGKFVDHETYRELYNQYQINIMKKVVLIPGDGIGPEIVESVKRVFSAAGVPVEWVESLAGESALRVSKSLLPDRTLDLIREHKVALKAPLTTPVGKGFRSVNVQMGHCS
jgi:hypothetical protein